MRLHARFRKDLQTCKNCHFFVTCSTPYAAAAGPRQTAVRAACAYFT